MDVFIETQLNSTHDLIPGLSQRSSHVFTNYEIFIPPRSFVYISAAQTDIRRAKMSYQYSLPQKTISSKTYHNYHVNFSILVYIKYYSTFNSKLKTKFFQNTNIPRSTDEIFVMYASENIKLSLRVCVSAQVKRTMFDFKVISLTPWLHLSLFLKIPMCLKLRSRNIMRRGENGY